MLNVVPDIKFYPAWQTKLFGRIEREIGAGASRFGVFTAWSHKGVGRPQVGKTTGRNPSHAELPAHQDGGSDGTWATIGSANLDGASLDEFQILRPFSASTATTN